MLLVTPWGILGDAGVEVEHTIEVVDRGTSELKRASALVGAAIGWVAGVRRDWLDAALKRTVDVMLVFPAVLWGASIVDVSLVVVRDKHGPFTQQHQLT